MFKKNDDVICELTGEVIVKAGEQFSSEYSFCQRVKKFYNELVSWALINDSELLPEAVKEFQAAALDCELCEDDL